MMSENRDYIALNLWSVLAPAIMLALLTISVNLTADAYVRSLGRSTTVRRRWRRAGLASGAVEAATIEGGGEAA
jgi:hypothetical protein